MSWRILRLRRLTYKLVLASISLTLVLAVFTPIASANQLTGNSLTLSSSQAQATSIYNIQFTLGDLSQTLGSVSFDFCSNSSLFVDPCTAPTGMDVSSAQLTSQAGETGFSLNPPSSPNELIISRSPSLPTVARLAYQFSNITNASAPGSYFLRIQTYTGEDASGSAIDQGALAFALNAVPNIQAQVPPYLTFCVGVTISSNDCSSASGDYVNFGELSPFQTATGTEQFLTQTNANSGYSVSLLGQTMTSGNNIIEPLINNSASLPGTSQFGLNLVANTQPRVGAGPSGPGASGVIASGYNQPNSFRFDSGETLVTSPSPSYAEKFTVSYIVNRPSGQPPGVYATTMTFVALGNF